MSIGLMTSIFQTEFRDLQDKEGNITKASTAKIVLLAMADCANDEGEGIYPSIDTLKKKCALSDQTIRNTFGALLHNGIIYRVGVSKHGTHNHNINPRCFPRFENRRDFPQLLAGVKPVEGSNELPEGSNRLDLGVKPVDPKHTLTIHKPDMLDMLLDQERQTQPLRDACIAFETAFLGGTISQWPWDSKPVWRKFAKWCAEQDVRQFTEYVEWRKKDGKYHAMSNNKIRQDPQMFMDTGWPTFLAHTSMYAESEMTRLL